MAKNSRKYIQGRILAAVPRPALKTELRPMVLIVDVGKGRTTTFRFNLFEYMAGVLATSDHLLNLMAFYFPRDEVPISMADVIPHFVGKPIWVEMTYVPGGIVYKWIHSNPYEPIPGDPKLAPPILPLVDDSQPQPIQEETT